MFGDRFLDRMNLLMVEVWIESWMGKWIVVFLVEGSDYIFMF